MNKHIFGSMRPEQQFWYAKVIIAVVMADERIDETETKYLRTIFHLFQDSGEYLPILEQYANSDLPVDLEKVDFFSEEIANSIFQDCIAVAIADAEFHPREEKLIRKIGECLQLSPQEIQSAINRGYAQLAHIFTFEM